MAYLIAWSAYLLMAALLQLGFERYLAPYLHKRRLRIGLRAALAIVLFTPGVVPAEGGLFLVPACIGVLFNVLAHSGIGLMKAALPLLFAATVVYGLLFLRDWRQSAEA